MKRAYVDSSVWITYVEGIIGYQTIVETQLHSFIHKNWQLCVSDAVILEVLAKPTQDNRQDMIDSYNLIFQNLKHLKTLEEIFKKALEVAEKDRLKGLDAVHVAFALVPLQTEMEFCFV